MSQTARQSAFSSSSSAASAMSLAELRQIAHDHVSWLQSDGRQGRRANLSGANLSGLMLQGIFMPEANLRGANLSGTNFQGSNFQGADFSEALLEYTNLRGAQMDGASFARCHAKGAYFDNASLIEANFTAANIEGASMIEAQLSGAKFREATLHRANFSSATMQQVTLRHASAFETSFEMADLSFADCRDAQFTYTRFKDTTLREANMRGAVFEHVLFTETDFTCALDVDSRYQAQSLESEKQGIAHELENLRKAKDELLQLEQRVLEQKQDAFARKKALESLGTLEAQVSQSLYANMKSFRAISAFWFVVVTLFATVLGYKIAQLGIHNLNVLEIGIVCGILVTVLGAHIGSAVLSYQASRQFASYVVARREKLAHVALTDETPSLHGFRGFELPQSVAPDMPAGASIFPSATRRHEAGFTYL